MDFTTLLELMNSAISAINIDWGSQLRNCQKPHVENMKKLITEAYNALPNPTKADTSAYEEIMAIIQDAENV